MQTILLFGQGSISDVLELYLNVSVYPRVNDIMMMFSE